MRLGIHTESAFHSIQSLQDEDDDEEDELDEGALTEDDDDNEEVCAAACTGVLGRGLHARLH